MSRAFDGTSFMALSAISRVTTFYVTPDQVEAMTMGDRVAVIKDGVLQQVAAPGALRQARQPLHRRVHRLAGRDLFESELAQVDSGLGVTVGAATMPIPASVPCTQG